MATPLEGHEFVHASACRKSGGAEEPYDIRPTFAYNDSVSIGFAEGGEHRRTLDRYVSTVAIAAAIITAVRLANVADLDLSIEKVVRTVQQSVRLARTILDEAMRI